MKEAFGGRVFRRRKKRKEKEKKRKRKEKKKKRKEKIPIRFEEHLGIYKRNWSKLLPGTSFKKKFQKETRQPCHLDEFYLEVNPPISKCMDKVITTLLPPPHLREEEESEVINFLKDKQTGNIKRIA